MEIQLDTKIHFFKENQSAVKDAVSTDPVMVKTLGEITHFMAYMGIEKLVLRGKTKVDDVKYRENLKKRGVNE